MSAIDFLKMIQSKHFKGAYPQSPNRNNAELLDEVISLLNDYGVDSNILRNHRNEMGIMPTPFQDPLYYHFLHRSFNMLREIIEKRKVLLNGQLIVKRQPPIYGSILSKKFNAITAAPENEPVILFNEGLLVLICGINDVLACKYYSKTKNEINNKKIMQ